MKVSCIIPTFNRGEVLLDTIRMLSDQDYPPHEVIVVDQSTDHSETVYHQLSALNLQGSIILVKQSEPNASKARNAGALASTGDIILFLDDDVAVESNFIASYVNAFTDPSVRGVAGQVLEIGEKPISELDHRALSLKSGWLYFNKRYDKPHVGAYVISCNMGVRREDFMSVRGMDENYARGAYREESDFAMRWVSSGRFFHYLPSVTLLHLAGKDLATGGQRHWTYKKPWMGMHHYFGAWYFLFCHWNFETLPYLVADLIRMSGFNRRSLKKFWLLPIHISRCAITLPKAIWYKIKGPKLIQAESVP